MLDAVSRSGTVFSDKFGKLAVEAVECIVIGLRVVVDWCVGLLFLFLLLFDGRITSMLPPCGRCITVVVPLQ